MYREHFREPDRLVQLILKQMNVNINVIIKGLAHELIDDADGDTHNLYEYFTEVYDEIYHGLIFRRLMLQDETKELLEVLATPLFQKTNQEQQNIIKKYIS